MFSSFLPGRSIRSAINRPTPARPALTPAAPSASSSSPALPFSAPLDSSASDDALADRVLGQADLVSTLADNGCTSGSACSTGLAVPYLSAIDPASGHLFTADGPNHRVLSWSSAASFKNFAPADLALGQPDMACHKPMIPPNACSSSCR